MRGVAAQGGASAQDASAAVLRLTKLAAQRRSGRVASGVRSTKPPPAKSALPTQPLEDESAAEAGPAPTGSRAAASATEATAAGPAAAAAAAAAAKERGTRHFKAKEYTKAAECYYECTKHEPSCHLHFSNLAFALLKLGQPAHAQTAAERCTCLSPAFVKGHFRLGQALRTKREWAAAERALREGLKHALTDAERSDLQREILACRKECRNEAAEEQTAPAAATAIAPAPESTSSGAWAAMPSPVISSAVEAFAVEASPVVSSPVKAAASVTGGAKVDLERAVTTARRVADRAVDAMPPSAASTFSAFERLFNALWANGRGATSNAAPLCACLDSLPEDEGSFVKFVGDAMTDELIGAIVLAAEAVMLPEHTERAAALVCRLVAIRRFDVLWMMQGKRETAAVEAVLGAARKKSTDSKPLDAAAKRFGVQLQ